MTDTRTPPTEPGAALPRAGRFFRPGTPARHEAHASVPGAKRVKSRATAGARTTRTTTRGRA